MSRKAPSSTWVQIHSWHNELQKATFTRSSIDLQYKPFLFLGLYSSTLSFAIRTSWTLPQTKAQWLRSTTSSNNLSHLITPSRWFLKTGEPADWMHAFDIPSLSILGIRTDKGGVNTYSHRSPILNSLNTSTSNLQILFIFLLLLATLWENFVLPSPSLNHFSVLLEAKRPILRR